MAAPPAAAAGEAGRAPASPGADHLAELFRLSEIGYIRGIEAKLADLARIEDNTAFVDASRGFVQAFDMAGFTTFLKDIDATGENGHG